MCSLCVPKSSHLHLLRHRFCHSALISLSSGFTTSSCCASAGAYSQKSEPYHIYHTKSLDRGLFPKTLPTLFEKTVPSCIARILVLVTCSLLAALSAASRSIAFSCSIEESSFCRLRRETRDAVKSSWAVSSLVACIHTHTHDQHTHTHTHTHTHIHSQETRDAVKASWLWLIWLPVHTHTHTHKHTHTRARAHTHTHTHT
jgi:hypothetical protein